MEENTNINSIGYRKEIVVSAVIALGFIAITVGVILLLDTIKSGGNKAAGATSSDASNDDMASMHAPPAPADNTKFNSLLNNSAPDFNLESFSGERVSLSDLNGKNVVLFFSEGAMCYPGCWAQIDAFVDDAKKFAGKNTEVYTVVVDPKRDWQGAVDQDKKMASANVLLDIGGKVSSVYGMLTVDSSMHRGQFPGHTYVIIDKEGVIRYQLDDPGMGINNGQLLAQISKL